MVQGNTSSRPAALHYLPFLTLALVVGVISGLAAVILRKLIAFMHNLFFVSSLSIDYTEIIPTAPSQLGMWVILVPVLGAICVTWLIENAAAESKGHGVPQVMYAIHYQKGVIRPIVGLIKSLGAAITIGTGGSAGREGPIIQIGGSVGSTVGQIVRMPVHQRCILVAAGAAAGLASTFNAPIGGLLFAIELLLASINATSIAAVTTATVSATFIGYLFYGVGSVFFFPILIETISVSSLFFSAIAFIPFGILIGIASYLFIEGLYLVDIGFHKKFQNPYLRHVCGMFLVGTIFYLMLRFFGHYFVEGLGYSVIQMALSGEIAGASLFFIIFVAKLAATALTIGSGGSGGVFLPSLVMGACLGGGYGYLFVSLFPSLHIPPVLFIVAGMGGMLSGTAGAVMTAIVMMPELTRDYYHTIPNMITVVVAYGVRSLFTRQTIYTTMLHRSGVPMPHGLRSGPRSY